MGLNKSKGNMYPWITHTWNAVKGECPHGCTYCYMKRWGKQKPPHFDHKELKEFDNDLVKCGEGQFIFIGSSIDLFANAIQNLWIQLTLGKCLQYDNQYLFQTKNPERINKLKDFIPKKTIICTTIETNRWYKNIMQNSPKPGERVIAMNKISGYSRYLTIEPIMDFDIVQLVELVKKCNPKQVNIGADSGNNKLPEPEPGKLMDLIDKLESFTIVKKKKNLKRLL